MHKKFDYAIAILKPDGVKTKRVYERLIEKLSEYELEVIKEKEVTLRKDQVLKNFTSPFNVEIYSEYLSSSKIKGILVRGDGATHILRDVKLDFRKDFGYTSKDMRNLLHTTDHGIEFKLQFKTIFPELNILDYCNYSDMCVRLEGTEDDILSNLLKIEQQTNLKQIGIICENIQTVKAVEKFKERQSNLGIMTAYKAQGTWESQEIELFGFVNELITNFDLIPKDIKKFMDWANENKGTVFLNYLPLKFCNKSLLQSLKDMGLKGVQVYDPRSNLSEAEIVEDIIEDDFGLFVSGGTNGLEYPGTTGIGKFEFENMFRKIERC